MIDNKLKIRLQQIRVTQKELCEFIKMTPQGLSFAIRNNTLELRKLELISQKLNVPMIYWFTDEQGDTNTVREVFATLEKIVVKELNK
jgi:transcriptional regulator with XRE-family HTH domain